MTQGRYSTRATVGVILALAWPTMLDQLLHTAVQYIDTAMVGSLGTAATAAVWSTTTVNWLIGSTVSAIGVGFLAFVSRARGAGEDTLVRRATAQAVLAVLAVGLFFTALTLGLSPWVPRWMQVEEGLRSAAGRYFFILYTPMLFRAASIIFGTLLRSAGDTRTPMWVGLGVNVVNVTLNLLCIYPTRHLTLGNVRILLPGLGLGVTGAALASAIAFALGGTVMTVAVLRHPILSPRGQSFRPDGSILRPCLRVALPNAGQRFGTSLGYVAFAAMVNSLGGVATAAHTFANTVESAFYIPGYGMQTAAATLAGNSLGEKHPRKLQALSRTACLLELCFMGLSGGLLFLLAPHLMRLFSSDPQVVTLGTTVLRMVALSEPFYGISIVLEGMLQGMGRTTMPLIWNLSGMWGVRILGTFLCVELLGMGLVAAWAYMILHNLMLFAVFFTYYLSGRWNPLRIGKSGA